MTQPKKLTLSEVNEAIKPVHRDGCPHFWSQRDANGVKECLWCHAKDQLFPERVNTTLLEKPDWWPQCPWPEDVWTNTLDQISPAYKRLVADDHVRTCFSGVLMRHGWRLAEKQIMERLAERGIKI